MGGLKFMFSTGVKIEVQLNNPGRKRCLQTPFPQTVKVKKNKIKFNIGTDDKFILCGYILVNKTSRS